jgi:hypothetical protein
MKAKPLQLSFFDDTPAKRRQVEPKEHRAPPEIPHHHIEVGYSDGSREITCTASGRDPRTYRQDQLYAGFVGPGYATFEECPLCNPKSQDGK